MLVIDDHPIVRERLAELINQEADLMVVAEAEDSHQARKAVVDHQPDIAIVDITLKDTYGIELIKEFKDRHPGLPMLVLSMHDETLYGERALRAGARGYLTKQEATKKVVDAIRKVLFQLLGQGKTVKEIAESLFVSAKTVEAHREHIKQKMNFKTSAELLRYAIQFAL